MTLLLAYFIHAIGIGLPVLGDTLLFALLSVKLVRRYICWGLLVLCCTMAGRFYPTKPAKLMGMLTMSYGVPQIIAPTVAGYLAAESNSYNIALYMASGFVLIGFFTIVAIKKWAWKDMSLLES